jgi:hypothetical protein
MDNDILMNDGEYFQAVEPFHIGETDEQKNARKVAEGNATANKDVLQSVIDRLTERLNDANTVTAIKIDPLTNTDEFMRIWFANQKFIEYVNEEIEYWKNQLSIAK